MLNFYVLSSMRFKQDLTFLAQMHSKQKIEEEDYPLGSRVV